MAFWISVWAMLKEYFAFMKQHMPNADAGNANHATGYHHATLLMTVLRACKDDFSRDNLVRQAASLKSLRLPMLLIVGVLAPISIALAWRSRW